MPPLMTTMMIDVVDAKGAGDNLDAILLVGYGSW